eukprot:300578_1
MYHIHHILDVNIISPARTDWHALVSAKRIMRYRMIHELLQEIHSNIPTMSGLLMNCLIDLFPNILKEDSDIISGYVQRLLGVIQYIPELRPQIIQLIIEKMILIDVEIEKRDKNNSIINNNIEYKNNDDEYDDEDSMISDEREDDINDINDNDTDTDTDIDDNEYNDDDMLTNNLDNLMCLMFDYIKIMAQ